MNEKDKPKLDLVKVHELIQSRSTYELIADFEATDDMPMSEELPIVRGWLMDELERRNKAAFDCWLESNEASPRKFFVV